MYFEIIIKNYTLANTLYCSTTVTMLKSEPLGFPS